MTVPRCNSSVSIYHKKLFKANTEGNMEAKAMDIYPEDNELTSNDYYEETVTDDNYANFLIRKLKEKREEAERFKQFYQSKILQEQERLDNYENYVSSVLQRYLSSDNIIPKVTKTEIKYELPDGLLRLKKQPKKYVRNDEELLNNLKDAGENQFIVTKYSVDWANLKKVVETSDNGDVILNGEILSGVHAEDQPDKFTIS